MYAAQVTNNIVQRVIVAPSLAWCAEHLGGDWVETADPYTERAQIITYCGPGYGYDPTHPARFAPAYRTATPQERTERATLPRTERERIEAEPVYHEGRIRTRTDVERARTR